MSLSIVSHKIRNELQHVAGKLEAQIADCEEKVTKVTKEKLEAQEEGDLRENAAYHTAVETLSRLNVELANLHNKKGAWEAFNKRKAGSDFVGEGATITLEHQESKEIFQCMLVPKELGDSSIGAVSITSPVGKAVLGKTVGMKVSVTTSVEKGIVYTIKEIY